MSIFEQSSDWLNEIKKEFTSQSDRASAIVGASVLDELLRDVISAFFIQDTKKGDNLLGTNMPL